VFTQTKQNTKEKILCVVIITQMVTETADAVAIDVGTTITIAVVAEIHLLTAMDVAQEPSLQEHSKILNSHKIICN
jgi:hypothetical protein